MNKSYQLWLAEVAVMNPYHGGVQPHGMEEERAKFEYLEAERRLVREVGREEADRLMDEVAG